jgi:hypothetical protein
MTNHERTAGYSREPANRALDEQHLSEMTLGDRSLEREVLQVFSRQITLMLKRIARSEPALAAAAAHTLKGSALGLGAWRVAEAAERVAATEVCGVIDARVHDAGADAFALHTNASLRTA